MKKLLEVKMLSTLSYCEPHIKVGDVFLTENKMKENSNINQIYPFLKDKLAEHKYLAILNCECNHV